MCKSNHKLPPLCLFKRLFFLFSSYISYVLGLPLFSFEYILLIKLMLKKKINKGVFNSPCILHFVMFCCPFYVFKTFFFHISVFKKDCTHTHKHAHSLIVTAHGYGTIGIPIQSSRRPILVIKDFCKDFLVQGDWAANAGYSYWLNGYLRKSSSK